MERYVEEATEGADDPVEPLHLHMEFLPPSADFGKEACVLRDHYWWEDGDEASEEEEEEREPEEEAKLLILANASDFVRRTFEFALDKGIRKQMAAVRGEFFSQFLLELRQV